MARLDEYLTDEEFNIPEEIEKDGKNRSLPKPAKERLLQLGYIQKTANGPRITSAGRIRLALGR
jgi:hypothetical protein